MKSSLVLCKQGGHRFDPGHVHQLFLIAKYLPIFISFQSLPFDTDCARMGLLRCDCAHWSIADDDGARGTVSGDHFRIAVSQKRVRSIRSLPPLPPPPIRAGARHPLASWWTANGEFPVASHRRDGFAVVCERMDEPSRIVESRREEGQSEERGPTSTKQRMSSRRRREGSSALTTPPNGRSRLERPKPELARDRGAFCTDGFCAMAGSQFQAKTSRRSKPPLRMKQNFKFRRAL